MALLLMDSFDHYTTGKQAGKWDNSVTIIAALGRRGTACLESSVYKTFSSNYTTLMCGIAAYNSADNIIFSVYDGIQRQCYGKYVSSDGSIRVYDGNGTQRATSGAIGLVNNTYHHYQFKFTIHNGSGVAVVKVDNVTVINTSSLVLAISANNYGNKIYINQDSNGRVDDAYILDDSGTYNNDLLGDLAVTCIFPDGAGTTTQWTASAGSNYQCVDESAQNEDTDYVSTSTGGNIDLYSYGAVGITGTVYGVQATAIARKDDAGSRTARIVGRVNSTNYTGSTISLTDNYSVVQKIWEKNPNSTNAWAVSEIDSSEFGIELVS